MVGNCTQPSIGIRPKNLTHLKPPTRNSHISGREKASSLPTSDLGHPHRMSDDRSLSSEVQSLKSEVLSPKSVIRNLTSEVRSPKSKVRSQKSQVRCPLSFSLRKESNQPLRRPPIQTFSIRPKNPAFPKLSPKCQTSISRQSPLQNRPAHASSHASSSDLPTVPFAKPPDTCLLLCVKFRLGDSPICRTEVTRQK